MIIKSLSRTAGGSGGAGGLMKYMFQRAKIENQLKYQTRDGNLSDLSVRHLLKGSSVSEWIDEFEDNQRGRKFKSRNMVTMHHDIISFAVKDSPQLNNEKLKDMARQYIRLRSPNAPAVATFHHDAKHLHIHIALAGAKYKTGLANRVSKFEFASIKQQMEEYQRATYPELINSQVEHGKGIDYQKEEQYHVRKRKQSKRGVIRERLGELLPQAASIEELKQLLEEEGIPHYERGGRIYGVTVDGRNYRFSTLGFAENIETLEQEDFEMAELGSLRSEYGSHEKTQSNSRLDHINGLAEEGEDIPFEADDDTSLYDMDLEDW